MVHYQYRWLYAAAVVSIIFLASYCYDLSPIISQLQQQKLSRKKQEEQLTIYKHLSVGNQKVKLNVNNIMHKLPKDEVSILNELSRLLRKHNLTLQTLTTFSKSATHSMMVHWVIAGEFEHIVAFIFALSNQLPRTYILNFLYKVNEQVPTFTADVLIDKNKVSIASEIDNSMQFSHNPFCQPNPFEQNNEVQRLKNLTLQQINMVAFLKQDTQREAWIMLPNKSAVNVHIGSVLGKEHMRVIDIQQDRIVLLLSDNTKYVVRM